MTDQFAGTEHAKLYSKFRKDTPGQVIEKIIYHLKEKYKGPLNLAVDIGCGSGQGSVSLAPFFKEVRGFDVSESQIKEAKNTHKLINVTYQTGLAEELPFPDESVQLITAGSALHWFDLDKFFPEARRVLCNDGILSVYGYLTVKPLFKNPVSIEEVNQLYDEHFEVLIPYFRPEVKISCEKYMSISFPFEEVIREPEIRCTYTGQLTDVVGYVISFSAVQNCRKENPARADDIINKFRKRLYEIGAKENVAPDQPLTLYRDYFLINCRKMAPSSPGEKKFCDH